MPSPSTGHPRQSSLNSDSQPQAAETPTLDPGHDSSGQHSGDAIIDGKQWAEKSLPTQDASDNGPAADGDKKWAVNYPRGLALLSVVSALVLCMLVAVMDLTILATAIPKITDDFSSLNDVGWYASAYFMTFASSQSTWGKAYKYFDVKSTFLISLAVFELGSLICGVARDSATVIGGRAVTGYGAAGVLAGCYTIVAFAVSPERRPAFTGVLAVTYGLGSSIAPVIGGVLADKVSWRWCFYLNLPVGGASAVLIFFTFKSPSISRSEEDIGAPLAEKIRQMDFPGNLVLMAALTCLLLALQWGGVEKDWKSSDIIGLFVGCVTIFVLFIVVEWFQGDRALLVPHIMKKRVVYMGSIVAFFLGGGDYALIYYLPIYFQSIRGTSAEQSGVRTLAFIIPVTLFTVISGATITAMGYFTPLVVIGSALTTTGSGLIYTFSETSSSGTWIGYQVIVGVGIGLAFQAPIMAAQALAEPRDVSATTAIMLFFQVMGGAVWVSVAQSAFTNALVERLAVYAPDLDPVRVIAAGATGLRDVFTDEEVPGIIRSYMDGLKVTFAIIVALTGVATVASLAMPWTSIKGKVDRSTLVAA